MDSYCREVWKYSILEGDKLQSTTLIIYKGKIFRDSTQGLSSSQFQHLIHMTIKIQSFSQFCAYMTKYWCLLLLPMPQLFSYRFRNNIGVMKGTAEVWSLVNQLCRSGRRFISILVRESVCLLLAGMFLNLWHHHWRCGGMKILIQLLIQCWTMLVPRSTTDAMTSCKLISVTVLLPSPPKK